MRTATGTNRLKEFRVKRLWTQKQLAKKAKVSDWTVRQAEKGRPISDLTKERLSRALETPVDVLFPEEAA